MGAVSTAPTTSSAGWIKGVLRMFESQGVDIARLLQSAQIAPALLEDPHVRLDYAFVPDAFKGNLQRCEVVRDHPKLKNASDHFPLVTELSLK